MSCPKCGGLVIDDPDRDSLTGKKCVNCGGDGMKPKMGSTDGGGNCRWKRPKCEAPRAPDSVYCMTHRDKKRAMNQAQKDKRNKIKRAAGRTKTGPTMIKTESVMGIPGKFPVVELMHPSLKRYPLAPGPPSADRDSALKFLDEAIATGEARIVQLKAAREIVARM